MELELITLSVMVLGGAVVGFAVRGIRSFLKTGELPQADAGKAMPSAPTPAVIPEKAVAGGDELPAVVHPEKASIPRRPPELPVIPKQADPPELPADGIWLARIDPTVVIPKAGTPIVQALLEAPSDNVPQTPFPNRVGGVWLRCIKGEYLHQSLEIPEGGVMIGRDPAFAHLILHDAQISGRHCRFQIETEQGNPILVLEDCESLNGTMVRFMGGGDHWETVKGMLRLPVSRIQGMEVQLAGGVSIFETEVRLG
ncbi:MAG: FHA domain-containing protein [Bacteroidetes Order II. Incertae sedis bacterium]|nr:FHA domain-containing protein [Bacteroidetes Order II. bacterium]